MLTVMACWKKAFNKLTRSPTPHQTSEGSTCKVPTRDCRYTFSTVKHLTGSIDAYLSAISQESQVLQEYYSRLNTRLSGDLEKIHSVYREIKLLKEDEIEKHLVEFRRKLTKLMLMSPSKYKIGADKDWHDMDLPLFNQLKKIISARPSKNVPQLYKSVVFETSMEFKDFEARYNDLDDYVKLCLLCFSIFPQGAVIRRRLMLQWWVVEGFASTEEEAVCYFEELMDKGFIEPVRNNRSLSVSSCRLHPFHRSALVALAERARLFNFESSGEPSLNFSGSFQACLKGAADYNEHDQLKTDVPLGELKKLHLLLNLSDQYLESIDEWFPKMKNVNFLYLGRWKASQSHEIVMNQESKLLKQLGMMKYVKILSLQGVSNITSIPHWVMQLKYLEVLDLRSCFNLGSIPDNIQDLKRLKHLDMSDCFLLAHMPKGLSHLKQLKVLKGFFVGHQDRGCCTLRDLQNLENLEKLCIYTDDEDFPLEEHVNDLKNLATLTKLTISWRVRHFSSRDLPAIRPGRWRVQPPKLPPRLEKLHLKRFPKSATPDWLKPKNLRETNLKKLYITGGRLCDLGQYQGIDDAVEIGNEWWKVEVLRLKYLGEMEMDWRQLQGLFPSLKYLEKVSCPRLTLFPCERVWINPQ